MRSHNSKLRSFAQGWGTLVLLHERVQARVEQLLLSRHGISVREYSLLSVLSRQHNGVGGHLNMKQVAEAVVLSQSATTRLVTRLEERGLLARLLCPTDRRGIYTNVTPEGLALLKATRPTHDAELEKALDEAQSDPRFLPLLKALDAMNSVS